VHSVTERWAQSQYRQLSVQSGDIGETAMKLHQMGLLTKQHFAGMATLGGPIIVNVMNVQRKYYEYC
jgi:hypothetical protein